MSFVSPAYTASKISEVEIDCDKDWQVKGITSLKELAVAMTKGDMLFFDGTRLTKTTPGSIGSILTTHDAGNPPTWTYPP